MPKISKTVLDTTFYLYPSVDAAEIGKDVGGTGFLVSLPAIEPTATYIYAVTNWHVAISTGASVIRLNKKRGGTEILECQPEDWVFDPKFDIAVIQLQLDDTVLQYSTIPAGMFVTRDTVTKENIGAGDDIFMVGRFIDHDGKNTNAPMLRFGNISAMPTPVKQPNRAIAESYCLDLHSRSGYSGSPVFVYSAMGQDLTNLTTVNMHPPFLMFLGIHYAQFPELWELDSKGSLISPSQSTVPQVTEGKYVVGLSGMSLALPAWNIMDILNLPKLRDLRAKLDADWAAKIPPTQ